MTKESRQALIIANSTYSDPKLAQLSAPDLDARALEDVLGDTKVGFFDAVTVLRNKTRSEVESAIFRLFRDAKRDDTLLLYFTGHGVLDNDGRLYLATSDTKTDALRISGIAASFIAGEMDHSRSRRQLLVLDCCHSGAFARGSRNSLDRSVGTKTAFEGENGRGRFIMTATDELQYAWEGDDLIREDGQSRFSYHFVEGLRSGKADREQNGYITVDDLYDYVFEQVKVDSPQDKPQTPRLETYRKEGSLLVAKNLHTYPKEKRPPPRRVGGLVTIEDLRKVLDDVFEAEQIENIAFDLRIDERSLGQTKSAKIRSLLRQLDQQDRLTDMLDWLHLNTKELFAEVFGKREAVEIKAKPKLSPPVSEQKPLVVTPEQLQPKPIETKAEPPNQPTPVMVAEKQGKPPPMQPAPTRLWQQIPLWGLGIVTITLLVMVVAINSFLRNGDELEITTTEAAFALADVVENIATPEPEGPTPIPTRFVPQSLYGIVWIEIPAGPFMMGAAKGDMEAAGNESPLHEVMLDTFWITQTEVTNAQYKEFVEATGYDAPSCVWERNTIPDGLEDHPVVCVSWIDVVAYTEWLSEETGMEITLPSEAEWEKAARGDDDTRIYPWGNDFDGDLLNCSNDSCPDDGFFATAPVGSYPNGASPYDVLDMSGNVWEWTRSLYDQGLYPYPYDLTDGREDVNNTSAWRVLRGGSWGLNSRDVRVSFRFSRDSVSYGTNLGFRMVVLRPSS